MGTTSPLAHASLVNVTINFICKDQKIFNNAAQHWNHSFYWHCLTPEKCEPDGAIKKILVDKWGSVDKFLEEFSHQAAENFGSGWTWLAQKGTRLASLTPRMQAIH